MRPSSCDLIKLPSAGGRRPRDDDRSGNDRARNRSKRGGVRIRERSSRNIQPGEVERPLLGPERTLPAAVARKLPAAAIPI